MTMPNSVQTVGRYAFGEMKKLSSIRLSKSLRKLEEGVFLGSKKLKKLTLPKNIKRFDGDFGWKKNKFEKIVIRTKNIKKDSFTIFPKMYGVCPEQKSEKTASEIRVWRKNRCEKEKG